MKKRVTNWVEYDDPDILRKVLNDYFDEQDASKLPYTISGVCLQVGCRRKTLLRSIPDTPIGCLLYQARMLIEQQHEIHLLTTKRPAGVVFALKNLGWSESAKLDVGFSPASGSTDKEAMKWTIEVVAPGQLPDNSDTQNNDPPKSQLPDNPEQKLLPEYTSSTVTASNMTIDMARPLRKAEDPDNPKPKPWFVDEFEATRTKSKKSKASKEPEVLYKSPKFKPDPNARGKIIMDIQIKPKSHNRLLINKDDKKSQKERSVA